MRRSPDTAPTTASTPAASTARIAGTTASGTAAGRSAPAIVATVGAIEIGFGFISLIGVCMASQAIGRRTCPRTAACHAVSVDVAWAPELQPAHRDERDLVRGRGGYVDNHHFDGECFGLGL